MASWMTRLHGVVSGERSKLLQKGRVVPASYPVARAIYSPHQLGHCLAHTPGAELLFSLECTITCM